MQFRYQFKTLEESLAQVVAKSKKKALSVGEILEILSGKGRYLLLILLALPFCLPIQIPGFSTPFGLIIAFFGLRIGFGHHIWLPKRLLERKIDPSHLEKIAEKSLWLVKKIRPLIHPRFVFLSLHPVMHMINGILLFLLGIFLALPLPIPFSNLISAWAIFFISLGLLEDDGLFVVIGYVLALLCAFFLLFIGVSIRHLFAPKG